LGTTLESVERRIIDERHLVAVEIDEQDDFHFVRAADIAVIGGQAQVEPGRPGEDARIGFRLA